MRKGELTSSLSMEDVRGNPTYLVSVDQYSEKALRRYGRPTVHITIWKGKLPPPREEIALRRWLLQKAQRKGIELPAVFRISRTQAKGERYRSGFHGIGTILLLEPSSELTIKNKFSGSDGVPGARPYSDFYFKREGRSFSYAGQSFKTIT